MYNATRRNCAILGVGIHVNQNKFQSTMRSTLLKQEVLRVNRLVCVCFLNSSKLFCSSSTRISSHLLQNLKRKHQFMIKQNYLQWQIVFKPVSFFSAGLTMEGDKKRKPSLKKSKHNLPKTNISLQQTNIS